jgi:hypothetical protein
MNPFKRMADGRVNQSKSYAWDVAVIDDIVSGKVLLAMLELYIQTVVSLAEKYYGDMKQLRFIHLKASCHCFARLLYYGVHFR